jgi:DNA repair protein RecN (Recombination protein N)
MLRSLHIRNYILIDSLDIDFPEGLVIITGQTGAGKSILLGALSLLFGVKTDASMLSEGASSCVVEAEFDPAGEAVKGLLAEEELETEDGGLVIRRVISASGRSRSFVNDCPVQTALLQRLSPMLIDIHSQHRSLLLSDRGFQLSVLDRFARNSDRLAESRRLWAELRSVRGEIASLREKLSRLEADREYNAAQLRQLEDAKLETGELEALEEEHKGLANAEQIMESLSTSCSLLSPQDDTPGVSSSLKEAGRELERISSFLPEVPELVSRLESARLEVEDINSELDTLLSRIDLSPERLEAVEERMSLLYSLLKKHGCDTIDDLIARRDSYAGAVEGSSALEEQISELQAREEKLAAAFEVVCAELSGARREAAPKLAESIVKSLRFLELERASFEVKVEDGPASADGADRVSFLFSSTGREPQELSKVASGGEMSRIMLCLKAEMAGFSGMPTMIFDEIDTGVSGSVADRMGQMICEMGRSMQVFSITHLPQVAAKGDAHYVVTKELTPEGRTVSSIHKVEGRDRVSEIARLLSGATITEAAIANAEALLQEAH